MRSEQLCPSAQHDWVGAQVIGIVGGTVEEPQVHFVSDPIVVEDGKALEELTAPVAPAEALRIAAPCARGGCAHFADSRCQVAARVVRNLAPLAGIAPACAIRPWCRWFRQEGTAACFRCPQVITTQATNDAALHALAQPTSRRTKQPVEFEQGTECGA